MAIMLTPAAAAAQVVAEVGDAGELLGTAQVIGGPVTRIDGTLVNLWVTGQADDIDLYRITISDTAGFSVTVLSNLSIDNDGQLFLFNTSGALVGQDDDTGLGLLPQFNVGQFSGLATGNYFLGYNLFASNPVFTGGALTGWSRNPSPYQTGPYSLLITGAGNGGVPEPSTWAMMLVGFGGLGAVLRRKRRDAAALA
jgi:hypothetical protein